LPILREPLYNTYFLKEGELSLSVLKLSRLKWDFPH
jgi:hypothetical protein